MPAILETYLGKPEIDHKFERAIQAIPLPVWCWSVGGGVDVLKMVTADIDAHSALDRHAY